MGLQLAEIDDGVAVIEPGGVLERFCLLCVFKVGGFLGKVPVEPHAGALQVEQARGPVDAAQGRFVVEPARAVAEDDLGAALAQELAQSRQQARMRRDCVVRRVGGDEICFDAHRHAWAQPGKGVQRLQGLAQGCAAGILRIICAGHAGDVVMFLCHGCQTAFCQGVLAAGAAGGFCIVA